MIVAHSHTHTHTHTYIYIHMYILYTYNVNEFMGCVRLQWWASVVSNYSPETNWTFVEQFVQTKKENAKAHYITCSSWGKLTGDLWPVEPPHSGPVISLRARISVFCGRKRYRSNTCKQMIPKQMSIMKPFQWSLYISLCCHIEVWVNW